jgi:hypothetical protein
MAATSGPSASASPSSPTAGGAPPLTVADYATVALAVVAIVTLLMALFTLVRTRRATGAQALFQFYTRWESDDLRNQRRRAASVLLQKLDRPETEVAVETNDVLTILEMLALYVYGLRVIKKREAWGSFASIVIFWVAASREYIDAFREGEGGDKTVFEQLVRLDRDLVRHDARRRGVRPADVRPGHGAIAEFLESESTLGAETPPLRTVSELHPRPSVDVRLRWRD